MRLGIFLTLALVTTSLSGAAEPPADLVLRGGTVYTLEDKSPKAHAVAVRGGRIVAVGDNASVAPLVGPKTRLVELRGLTVIPGFQEGHGHLMGIGFAKMSVDLVGSTSYKEVVARVVAAAKGRAKGEWILGRGWHQEKWSDRSSLTVRGFPTHDDLSAALPDNPVLLERADGHASLANAAALRLMHIDRDTKSPAGGDVIRNERGEPTGILVDNAQDLVKVPEPDAAQQRRALDLAVEECLRKGITRFHDAGASVETVALYDERAKTGALPMRLHVMLAGFENMKRFGTPRPEGPDGLVAVRAVKLYADGALGSRGAALLEPYTDEPSNSGLFVTSPQDLAAAAKYAVEHGFQPCIHAIGDRANRVVLDAFESALSAAPKGANVRPRIEHAQILDAAEIPRFAHLGVIASMQGIHCSSDRPWAAARLGDARVAEGAYVWRKLLGSGARIVNGTDAPVEDVDPLRSFYASVTRADEHGKPAGGFDPDQKMTRQEALASYTREGAFGAFVEASEGTIAVGKRADFTVLSKDIMSVPDREILDARVVYTIVGGAVRYERPAR